jgi:hypothetical protein
MTMTVTDTRQSSSMSSSIKPPVDQVRAAQKRPRIMQLLEGCSVFSNAPIPVTLTTQRERSIMAKLCSERKLALMYYEGAMSLWMRVRFSYQWRCDGCRRGTSCRDCGLIHLLLVALHLTIKYCGCSDTAYHTTSMQQAREKWHHITKQKLIDQEILMCQRLNWMFF